MKFLLDKDRLPINAEDINNQDLLSICAERVAYSKAVCEGEKEFVAICITCSSPKEYIFPCGVCRQFMSEFSIKTEVIVAKSVKDYKVFTLGELLPHGFDKENLE